MTNLDDEFRERLITTYREDAQDLLSEISRSLIELESVGIDKGSSLIEEVFRKIHSLKGASRAVSYRDIELICQNLENIFSLMKKGDIIPNTEIFDQFHQIIKFIRGLIASGRPDEQSSSEIIQNLRSITNSDTRFCNSEKSNFPSQKIQNSDQIREKSFLKENELYSDSHPPSEYPQDYEYQEHDYSIQDRKKQGTVRIDANKLERLIAGSDDLLTTRLFITQRMSELEEMINRFSLWHWNHTQVESDLSQIQEYVRGYHKSSFSPEFLLLLERLTDFLRYDRDFVTNFQHDLSAHIRATDVDRLALETSTSEISDLIHDAVLSPISDIISPFTEFVREYSRSSGKKIDLNIEGEEIEMDRRIQESLKVPLMHLIHNSIDHGIEYPDLRILQEKPERGEIRIKIAPHSGSKVEIEVSDDGSGIDFKTVRKVASDKGLINIEESDTLTDDEVIWLIFKSGLTTSPIITDLSGRGLGLAIVEDTITRLGGDLKISSVPGKGTSITMRLPVRLATLRGVIIRSEDQIYVFPIKQVRQVMRIQRESLIKKADHYSIQYKKEIIRVIRLSDILGVSQNYSLETDLIPIVIISYGAGQIACVVDEVIRVQEIVVRPLGTLLKRVKKITGAVVLGDGRIGLVLDPLELIQIALSKDDITSLNITERIKRKSILIVEDSVTSRTVLQKILQNAGYQVKTSVDGIDAFAKLKSDEFDMVVSDVDMPRMNGFTLTEKIRSDDQLSNLPVVLITSLDSSEDLNHGIVVGANAYIIKSNFEKNSLIQIIWDILK